MGNTIRDTEAIIIDLVKMDYETFISTSYLMQGDANHFTKSKPTERKKILADVLELTYYDQLEILAKTKSRDLKAKINSNKAIIAIRNQDISIKESTLKDIDKSSTSIEKITPKVEIKSLELDKLYEQERETRAQISEIKTKIFVIHGPNINLIGHRSLPNNLTMDKIYKYLRQEAKKYDFILPNIFSNYSYISKNLNGTICFFHHIFISQPNNCCHLY